jgi:tousled-like kinase
LLELQERVRLWEEEEQSYLARDGWPLLARRYQPLHLIGKGGFSEVYLAQDLDRDLLVAVKLSDVEHLLGGRGDRLEYLRHIRREYEVHKKLTHPHIVQLTEVLEVDNAICIVLEYCQGPTLAQLLRREGRLPEEQARGIAQQLLSVIAYLSEQRIVHYDLKPQNIIFQDGLPRVLDFGVCKVFDSEHSRMALTSQGMGTYCYLPPETFANNPILSPKVDIWSLGVIFYEMLFGHRPPNFELGPSTYLSFPPEPEVSADAKQFLRDCLSASLEGRLDPQSAGRHPYFQ